MLFFVFRVQHRLGLVLHLFPFGLVEAVVNGITLSVSLLLFGEDLHGSLAYLRLEVGRDFLVFLVKVVL